MLIKRELKKKGKPLTNIAGPEQNCTDGKIGQSQMSVALEIGHGIISKIISDLGVKL